MIAQREAARIVPFRCQGASVVFRGVHGGLALGGGREWPSYVLLSQVDRRPRSVDAAPAASRVEALATSR